MATLATHRIYEAEQAQTGAIVALWLPSDIAQRIALPGGEAPADLHLTLVHLGDAALLDASKPAIMGALAQWAAQAPALAGKFTGVARFNADEGKPSPFVALLDSPDLPPWRQSLYDALAAVVPLDPEYGFVPHVTLQYLDPTLPSPLESIEPIPAWFGQVVLAWAGEREAFGLAGETGATVEADQARAAARAVEAATITAPAPGSFGGREWEVTLIGPSGAGSLRNINGREYLRSLNGRWYSLSGLEASVPQWEGVQVFDNHLTDKQFKERQGMRSFLNEGAGAIVGVHWDAARKALRGTLKMVDRRAAQKLQDAWDQDLLGPGKPNVVGLSIDAAPFGTEALVDGVPTPLYEGFHEAISVDLVGKPAAGGSIDRLIASRALSRGSNGTSSDIAQAQPRAQEAMMEEDEKTEAAPAGAEAAPTLTNRPPVTHLPDGEVVCPNCGTANPEAAQFCMNCGAGVTVATSDVKAPPPVGQGPSGFALRPGTNVPVTQAQPQSREAANAANTDQRDLRVRRLECQLELDRKTRAAKLSDTQLAVIEAAFDGRVFESAYLDRAIAAAKAADAAHDPTGRAQGVGTGRGGSQGNRGSGVQVGMDQRDHAGVEFLRQVMGYEGFRQLETFMGLPDSDPRYHVRDRLRLVEGYQGWINSGRPYYPERKLSEWTRDMLGGQAWSPRAYEAVTTSGMTSIIKNALNLIIAARYSRRNEWWRAITRHEVVDNFDPATLVATYGFGPLSVVNEGEAYTELPWSDTEETAAPVKRGGYVGVTLEMLLRDKLNQIRAIPEQLANSWYNTKSAQVAGVFTTNSGTGPVMSDTGALFNATATTTAGGHANLLTTALGTTTAQLSVIRTAMMKQTDQQLGAGNKLMIQPKFLLVPVALETAANTLVNSEKAPGGVNNDPNPFFKTLTVIPVPEWTDDTDYALVADPAEWPAIWDIALRGNETPSLFTADSETEGAMFTNDVIRYKVRMLTFEFSSTYRVAPVSDFRGLHKENVAG